MKRARCLRLPASAGSSREAIHKCATVTAFRLKREATPARRLQCTPMSNETTFQGRRAVSIENDDLRVTVLPGGGHIAEVCDKASGINPLWTPPWTSIEPSRFDAGRHRDYG